MTGIQFDVAVLFSMGGGVVVGFLAGFWIGMWLIRGKRNKIHEHYDSKPGGSPHQHDSKRQRGKGQQPARR